VGKKIYVGNLPWALNNEELKEAFKDHGNVLSANIVTDKHTGRSRGFGFIKSMNGIELKGRKLVVAAARASA